MTSANAFYDKLVPYILSEAQRRSNEYPLWVVEGKQAIIIPNVHNATKRAIAQDGGKQCTRRCYAPLPSIAVLGGRAARFRKNPEMKKRNRADPKSPKFPKFVWGIQILSFHFFHCVENMA